MKISTALVIPALFLTSACVSVLPEPVVPEALYRLDAATPQRDAQTVEIPKSLTVYQPEGSSLLLGKDIIFQTDTGGLSVLRKAKWSDTVSSLLQAKLLERLSTTDGESAVSDATAARTDAELRWRVRDFVITDDEAIAAFQITVMTARKRQIVDQFDVRIAEPYSGASSEAGVEALMQAAASAMDEIAARLPESLTQIESNAESSTR